MSPVRIEPAGAEDLDALAGLLVDAVEGGASVGFLVGVTQQEAAAFWRTARRSPSCWCTGTSAAGAWPPR